jgi:hypothetical protein
VTNSQKISRKNHLIVIVTPLWVGELSYSFIFLSFYFLCISSVERESETTLVLFTLLWLVDLYIIPYILLLRRKLVHVDAFISALALERVLKYSHTRSLQYRATLPTPNPELERRTSYSKSLTSFYILYPLSLESSYFLV